MRSIALLAALILPLGAAAQTPPDDAPKNTFATLRIAPASFVVHGTTPSPELGKYGGQVGWQPDWFTLGFAYKQFDIQLITLTNANPFAAKDEYSLMFFRTGLAWRPMKDGALQMFDPYLLAGISGGGAGRMTPQTDGCTESDPTKCPLGRPDWGVGGFGGVGLDVNFTITHLQGSNQRLMAFVGFEFRGEVAFNLTSNDLGYYTVFALPMGFRLE